MTLIEIQEITKTFNDGTNDVDILKSTTVSINANEFTAIVGPSGSGKSTHLTILGALQTPTSGTITIDDKNVGDLDANQLSSLRFESIGFVFYIRFRMFSSWLQGARIAQRSSATGASTLSGG